MHDLAVVSRIQKIEPIEGKDRIVLATVENYKSIVQKDQFKEGDICIYIFYDSICPETPDFEFLRKRCYSPKWQGFRIRPMKMGGQVSEGLVMPIDLLPKNRREVGTVVTDDLGIRRYLPPEEMYIPPEPPKKKWFSFMFRFEWFRKWWMKKHTKPKRGYPETVPKSDEDNIERVWDKVKNMENDFVVTEKMEGQAATYYVDKKGKLQCFSHNYWMDSGNWAEVAKLNNFQKKLKTLNKIWGTEIAIQGEICGPNIQKNIYKFETLRFFLYGAYDVRTGKKADWAFLTRISKDTGIEMVPFLGYSKILPTVDEMLKSCEGESVFKEAKMREGTVWRTMTGGTHFKCKSRPYKVWFGE